MSLQSPKLTQAGALTTESPLSDLAAIVRSHTPLIAVETNEEPQIVSLVRQIARRLQIKAYRWTVTEGLQAFDACDQPSQSVLKSQEMSFSSICLRCPTGATSWPFICENAGSTRRSSTSKCWRKLPRASPARRSNKRSFRP